ncbi:hypothetical protein [Brevundimonas sp. R86498]|uniref:hypothetical protein n=1 Tax=Brevundimonas sp. R86498 TaxID=3093845 RepID=UPI0037CA8463
MTTRPMTEARFVALADAWGGDLQRWPAAEAASAQLWADAHPDAAARALFEARQTDAVLDLVPRLSVSTALRDRVIASAAGAGLRARTAWPGLRRLLWIGGAGWVAAACAGVLFGVTLGRDLAIEQQVEQVLDEAVATPLDDTEWLS